MILTKSNRILTPDAQADRDDFDSSYGWDGNCSCHLSPPCGSCTHPGNPRNQEEDPEAWMDDLLDLDELARDARAAVASTIEAAGARHLRAMAAYSFGYSHARTALHNSEARP